MCVCVRECVCMCERGKKDREGGRRMAIRERHVTVT